MKILYAGNGIFGLMGLVKILSYEQFSIDDVYILNEANDISNSSELIRNYAETYGLKIQEDPLKEKLKFDLLISVHWRKHLSMDLIKSSRIGGINLHPSLLPKYAGCSSLAWALLNSEKKVGYTWHLLDQKFDSGDIVFQKEINVKKKDNAFSLWNRVNLLGVNQIKLCIDKLSRKNTKLLKQDLSKRTYYPRGFPSYNEIKKKWPNITFENYKRASYFPNKSS